MRTTSWSPVTTPGRVERVERVAVSLPALSCYLSYLLFVLLQYITTSLINVTIYSHCFVTMSIAHVVISLLSDAASLFCFKIIVACYCIDVVLLLCFCSTVTASFLHFPFRCILTALYRIAIVLSLYRIVIVS